MYEGHLYRNDNYRRKKNKDNKNKSKNKNKKVTARTRAQSKITTITITTNKNNKKIKGFVLVLTKFYEWKNEFGGTKEGRKEGENSGLIDEKKMYRIGK